MDQSDTQPLVCPSHTTHYAAMVILGMIIGATALGAYIKFAPVDESNTYQAGFDAAKKLVEESSIAPMLQTSEDIRSLTGSVTSVEGNRITLHVASMNPFEDKNLADRIVVVTADTKILKLTQKDPKTFQSEMNAFVKKSQDPDTAPSSPPAPVNQTEGTVADITSGDFLSITTAENIKSVKEFSASEIRIQPRLTAAIN